VAEHYDDEERAYEGPWQFFGRDISIPRSRQLVATATMTAISF
jgi:hypothetical protein